MALLSVTASAEDGGVQADMVAADVAGDVFPNDGKTVLVVQNGGGSSITVTITAQVTAVDDDSLGPITKADATKVIAAGAVDVLGPFKSRAFNNSSSQVEVGYSGVTSVNVGCLSV